MIKFDNDWQKLLAEQFRQDYYLQLRQFLITEYNNQLVYPDKFDIFNALHATAFNDIKVVILGQDPYHGEGQAHGLSFSVKSNIAAPPSLQNIFKELHNDIGCYIPNNGYLQKWTEQGVLLLNTVLTVRAGQANSHRGRGWEIFTDYIISLLNKRERPLAFILWGRNAQDKQQLISNDCHFIVKSAHPSPLSAYGGFFGSRPFSRVNAFLKQSNMSPIDWQIANL